MKLRTELLMNNGYGKATVLVPEHYDAPMNVLLPLMEHDAMAAHALMQAMDEFDHEGWSDSANPIEWARERADEILREWTKQDEVKS